MAEDHRMNKVGEPFLNRVQRYYANTGLTPPRRGLLGYMSFEEGFEPVRRFRGVSELPRLTKALEGTGVDGDELEQYRSTRDAGMLRGAVGDVSAYKTRLSETINTARATSRNK